MRILALRGANLASLEGEFELSLDEGPLAETGVFAICGPTGSGKSTLLDGMCLALFETAPRLSGNARVRVGREGDDADLLGANDPRSILRKGAGSGFAEVDFEGVDGRRYRARWDVRRARNRPEGKLQASSMSLAALDSDERWEGRKTEVKEEIERRLGLSFDQFKRSVLLARPRAGARAWRASTAAGPRPRRSAPSERASARPRKRATPPRPTPRGARRSRERWRRASPPRASYCTGSVPASRGTIRTGGGPKGSWPSST